LDPLQLGSNSEEALVEAPQSTADFLIAQLTAIHFQKMTCGLQCLTDAGRPALGMSLGSASVGRRLEASPARAVQILKYVKEELEKHGTTPQAAPAAGANKSAVRFDPVLLLCSRFHEVAK